MSNRDFLRDASKVIKIIIYLKYPLDIMVDIPETFIGAIFAAIAGIAVSLLLSCINSCKERKKVAKAFHMDIDRIQRELECGIPEEHLFKLGYIYPEYGLYFVLRKEIYIFDKNLSQNIENFYSPLMGINAKIKVHNQNSNDENFDSIIKNVTKSADPLLKQLEKYF